MKKFASILSLAVLAGVAAYVSAEDPPKAPATEPASKPATTQSARATFNEYCAVEQENKVDPKAKTYTYNGKVIGFCCDDCIDDFKKNPEKYMAKIK
jgi:YHS domain-containing protein